MVEISVGVSEVFNCVKHVLFELGVFRAVENELVDVELGVLNLVEVLVVT